jgi:hypothetical protein
MRKFACLIVCLALVSASVVAQCSTLSVSGSVNAGQTVSIDVSGAPAGALTVLAAGTEAGSTTIMIPGSSLVLGIADLSAILPLGVADATGAVSLSVDVPADLPAGVIMDETYVLQAVSVNFSMAVPMFSFCVSNTANLVAGNG